MPKSVPCFVYTGQRWRSCGCRGWGFRQEASKQNKRSRRRNNTCVKWRKRKAISDEASIIRNAFSTWRSLQVYCYCCSGCGCCSCADSELLLLMLFFENQTGHIKTKIAFKLRHRLWLDFCLRSSPTRCGLIYGATCSWQAPQSMPLFFDFLYTPATSLSLTLFRFFCFLMLNAAY